MKKTSKPLLDSEIIKALVTGEYPDPFAVLGVHAVEESENWVARCFLPGAVRVEIVDPADEGVFAELHAIHEEGLYEGLLTARQAKRYRLKVQYPLCVEIIDDPYRLPSVISAEDLHLFHEGRQEQAYQFLGANRRTVDGIEGVLFAVWAPNASRVALVGDFNHWDSRVYPMRVLFGSGVWELFLPGIAADALYKFAIKTAAGVQLPLKADPYAKQMEVRPGTASRVPGNARFDWQDQEWMASRANCQGVDSPISIYEVHLGSWRRKESSGEYFNYRELANELIPYAKGLGFTHLQLMPVSEHPFGGSWGYQPIGMFAPTSRYGSADDFRYFVDLAHQNHLGVLLDWVPGHFPTDQHGLGQFDGTHLYEHEDPRQGFHPDWKTYIFNYERPEVCSYLLSNAMYWLTEFHVDGLRFDAVASMLYLDYSREDGEWLPNHYGGRENLAAIEVLRLINTRAYGRFADVLMIAEESTAWPGVTQRADSGGLGFGFKWNLGWMNDTLEYMQRDPIHRQYHHNEMTFGLIYAFSENFILPLSHDEVVHGKRALIEKMPGDEWQKFANLRGYLGFMWGHPGKQLLFMGGEFAQRSEWKQEQSLEWHLLQYQDHQGVQKLVSDLNEFYLANPALWNRDNQAEGFEWVTAGEHSGAIFVFIRRGWNADLDREEQVLVVTNLTPTLYQSFRVGVPGKGLYTEKINTNSSFYGGTDHGNSGAVEAQQIPSHGRPWSVDLTLPPLATLFLKAE